MIVARNILSLLTRFFSSLKDQEICKHTFNEAQKQIGVIYQQLKTEEELAIEAPQKPSLDPGINDPHTLTPMSCFL